MQKTGGIFGGKKILTGFLEDTSMPSFQHFQNQAEQKSGKPKYSNDTLTLSVILQYAESAKKKSFEALCGVRPLVKAYRDKIQETSQAMAQAESTFEDETEIPEAYAAALALVKESFALHLKALDELMSGLAEKSEAQAAGAVAKVKQSGQQLETSLKQLSVPK